MHVNQMIRTAASVNEIITWAHHVALARDEVNLNKHPKLVPNFDLYEVTERNK